MDWNEFDELERKAMQALARCLRPIEERPVTRERTAEHSAWLLKNRPHYPVIAEGQSSEQEGE